MTRRSSYIMVDMTIGKSWIKNHGSSQAGRVDRYATELSTECTQSMYPEACAHVNECSDTEHSVANMATRTPSYNTSLERKDERITFLCQIEHDNISPVWTKCWQTSYRSRSGWSFCQDIRTVSEKKPEQFIEMFRFQISEDWKTDCRVDLWILEDMSDKRYRQDSSSNTVSTKNTESNSKGQFQVI